MNRSFSKIRHIQEANQILEKRLLSEQTPFGFKSSEEDQYDDTDFRSDNFNFEKYQLKSKRAQIQDIIDNFESINCDNYISMQVDEFGNEVSVPEHVQIYCEYYRGKSKEDMINILNNLN